jgi:hypothetical protein
MRPRDEWLNQEIERARLSADDAWKPDEPAIDDPEVMELASLARSLQTAPPLQVDPEFARHLEQRVLAYNAARQRKSQSRFAKGGVTFMPYGLRRRFWFETGLAIVTGILFVTTLVWHDWIEILFNVDPDQGSGLLEWLIVGGLLIATITLLILARYEWRRTQVATS